MATETISMTREDLDALVKSAIQDATKVIRESKPIAAPVDLTGFNHKNGNKALVKNLMRFVAEGDPEAPHTYRQRQRLLAIADRGGPDFAQIQGSGMNRITAAVASYWLEKGRPVTFGDLAFIPRMS